MAEAQLVSCVHAWTVKCATWNLLSCLLTMMAWRMESRKTFMVFLLRWVRMLLIPFYKLIDLDHVKAIVVFTII